MTAAALLAEPSLWAAVLAAAVLSLDQVHVGLFGLGRPIVVAPVVGWILGAPEEGLWIGAWSEAVWVTIIPAGHYGTPDASLAAAAAVLAAWVLGGLEPHAAAVVGLSYGIPWGYAGRKADAALRAMTARRAEAWCSRRPPPAPKGTPVLLLAETVAAKAAASGAFLFASVVLAALLREPVLAAAASPRLAGALPLAAAFLPFLAAAALFHLFQGPRHPIPFVAGLAAAAAFWAVA